MVWEYMAPKMRNDLLSQSKSVPAEWEWVGDVESLTIELTHRTYYIEVCMFVCLYVMLSASEYILTKKLRVGGASNGTLFR